MANHHSWEDGTNFAFMEGGTTEQWIMISIFDTRMALSVVALMSRGLVYDSR